MRLFVAAVPDAMCRQRLSEYIGLCGAYPDLRWTRPENLHCTLLFIGEVHDDHASLIDQGLRQALRGVPALRCVLRITGFFKNREGAVLWVGIEPPEPIMDLAARIRQACPGFGDAKPFKPHLTIGRGQGRKDWRKMMKPLDPLAWHIDRIFLLQSRLMPEGAVYTVNSEFTLSQIDPL